MNINYLMGLCFVAVSVAATLKFIVWLAATYPLGLTVAVVFIVAVSLFIVYDNRSGRIS